MTGRTKTDWFRQFFAGAYGQVLARTFTPEQSMEQARLVRRLLRVRAGSRVLDVPCGQGRLTLPLAQMGLAMTGVDLTAAYVAKARRQADVDIRYICRDMRQLDFDREFHAAFNWFGSLGYFSDAENLDFCRRVWRALKPGGRFLCEGLNRPWMLRHFHARIEEDIAGTHIRHVNRWDARAGRIESTWTFVRHGRIERQTISMRIYSKRELTALLNRAGFVDIRMYAAPPVGPYVPGKPRWIAVARRPG